MSISINEPIGQSFNKIFTHYTVVVKIIMMIILVDNNDILK